MYDRSAALYREALEVIPGGVSRNTLLREPHPVYVRSGKGCRVVDVDGHECIDFANNMAALIHGHAHPAMVAAVTAQLQRGTAFSKATEAEILLARHLCGRSPAFDKVRFMNSGTEAVMAGIKAARAFTGRPALAKVEGTYHGAYDYAEVSQAPDPEHWGEVDRPRSVPLARGTPESVLRDVVVLPFNDVDAAVALLDAHRERIGCVLLDLLPHRVGLVPAADAFVRALRDWTTANGALLLFDEVVTFRNEIGGTQARYATNPDLTAMGKCIGGGFPVGALAGRDEVMEVFAAHRHAPALPHSGTFSANPVTMTAGLSAMELYDAEAVARLNRLGRLARSKIQEAIEIAGAPATVTGAGSLFRIHLKAVAPTDYRSSYLDPEGKRRLGRFVDEMYKAGIVLLNTASGALSTPMMEADIDRLADAVVVSLRKLEPIRT